MIFKCKYLGRQNFSASLHSGSINGRLKKVIKYAMGLKLISKYVS
jgi:hypothetical protein